MAHNYYKPIVAKATSTKANRIIVISIGATAGVLLLARVSGSPSSAKLNEPGDLLRLALGSGFSVIFLMLIAEASPDIAIGLALIIALSATLSYGGDFEKAVMNGTLRPGKVVPK